MRRLCFGVATMDPHPIFGLGVFGAPGVCGPPIPMPTLARTKVCTLCIALQRSPNPAAARTPASLQACRLWRRRDVTHVLSNVWAAPKLTGPSVSRHRCNISAASAGAGDACHPYPAELCAELRASLAQAASVVCVATGLVATSLVACPHGHGFKLHQPDCVHREATSLASGAVIRQWLRHCEIE